MKQLTKISLTLLMLFTMTVNGLAQNLVPNPNLEDTVFCPWAENQLPTGWTTFGETPDYFHPCATFSQASVPTNTFGYQQVMPNAMTTVFHRQFLV